MFEEIIKALKGITALLIVVIMGILLLFIFCPKQRKDVPEATNIVNDHAPISIPLKGNSRAYRIIIQGTIDNKYYYTLDTLRVKRGMQ